jgi:hypothetical protein
VKQGCQEPIPGFWIVGIALLLGFLAAGIVYWHERDFVMPVGVEAEK